MPMGWIRAAVAVAVVQAVGHMPQASVGAKNDSLVNARWPNWTFADVSCRPLRTLPAAVVVLPRPLGCCIPAKAEMSDAKPGPWSAACWRGLTLTSLAIALAASCRGFERAARPLEGRDGGGPSDDQVSPGGVSGGTGNPTGGDDKPYAEAAGGAGATSAGMGAYGGGTASAGIGGDHDQGASAGAAGHGAGGDGEYEPRALGALVDSTDELESRRLAPPEIGVLPSDIDLAAGLPPPGDQGAQLSSVAWAVASIKTYQEGLSERWDIKSQRYQFSPSWIYNQTNHGVDGGVRPSAALQLIVETGADTLKWFPYRASYQEQPDQRSFARAGRFKGTTWGTLDADVLSFKKVLAAGQPILVTFEVFSDFDDLNDKNPSYDVIEGDSRGRQAVVLIGYRDDTASFRLINSWGIDWGLSGYGLLDFALVNDARLGLSAYTLRDGVNGDPPAIGSLYTVESGHLWRISSELGDFSPVRVVRSQAPTPITALGQHLYMVLGEALLQVDPGNGASVTLGTPSWEGATAMTALGTSLYVTQAGGLWRVADLTSGLRTRLGASAWNGTTAMTALDGMLYIIEQGQIYQVDPITGDRMTIGGADWYGDVYMTGLGENLYLARDGLLWRVQDLQSGEFHAIGSEDWTAVSSMVEFNGRLYVICAEQLWEVDPTTGAREAIGAVSWFGPTFTTALR